MNTISLKRTLAAVVLLGVSALSATAAPPKPAVTPAQAKASAMARIPGKALSAKYEFEDGHWQYAVVVQKKNGTLYEVEVNSTTGKVTASEKTSAAEEAKEAAADQKAAHKTNSHSGSGKKKAGG